MCCAVSNKTGASGTRLTRTVADCEKSVNALILLHFCWSKEAAFTLTIVDTLSVAIARGMRLSHCSA